ncbi:Alpha/Beta hydrolase protein [Pseudomassariella vexata]|uniref:Alpha/Beta hydrolase protein n=1 Tax=Pseudomassariella vexata TaxID=1141098 RepID=A0A1Y2EFG3_9PEZI|nr:Alpha/Beta hydrolase protein [Pseudomassariella vexata]ORY70310.1 Alpha/Beta hydrolase protein [Pseudomassariella vexata]
MLPKPSLCFTLPSIHDSTKLDCRVYHPDCLTPQSTAPQWGRHVAIVAHPYAPFGGSHDDHIVDLIGATLLQLGYMVATFNFRGASSPGAHTSWTSKPERADYMSVVGFMAYYAHYIDSKNRINAGDSQCPTMLLAGYSYGAMVTTKLPPLAAILSKFESPTVYSPAADIRLRAQHLAEQQDMLFSNPASPRKSLGMRVGGDEGSPRKSYDYKRSHSMDPEDKIRTVLHEVEHMEMVNDLMRFRSAYLVVSPPVGIMTNLATLSFPNPFASWSRKATKVENPAEHESEAQREEREAEQKLIQNPSLIIVGDRDGFLTLKEYRRWAAKLRGHEKSLFRDLEVSGAGHFWAEEGVLYKLRDAVGDFGADLLGDRVSTLHVDDCG